MLSPVFADLLFRLAGAIVLQSLAFVVWNIGTRAPWTVLNDMRNGIASRRTVIGAVGSFAVGAIFMAAATVLLLPYAGYVDLVAVEIYTLLVALLVEFLIGNDVRRLLRR